LFAACLLGLALLLPRGATAAADPSLEVQVLDLSGPQSSPADVSLQSVTSGSLDSHFKAFNYRETVPLRKPFWLKLKPSESFNPPGGAAVNALKGRHLIVTMFASREGRAVLLPKATELPGYAGTHEAVFVVPEGLRSDEPLYAYVTATNLNGARVLKFAAAALDRTLARGNAHAIVIALTFGALVALSLASLLMWFSLSDRLFLLYAAQFTLNALYVSYLTGPGFDWPILKLALPLSSDAWNVPAALGGASASLFIREIANLRRYSPRAYVIFGWMAIAFVVLAASNFLKSDAVETVVVALGNVIFIFSAIFTLLVAARSWKGEIAQPVGFCSRGACWKGSPSRPRRACYSRTRMIWPITACRSRWWPRLFSLHWAWRTGCWNNAPRFRKRSGARKRIR
jgi:hypothetical protein